MVKRSFRPAVSAFLLTLTMSLLSAALSFFVAAGAVSASIFALTTAFRRQK